MREHPGFQVDWSNPIMSAMAGDGWSQLEAMLLVFVLLAAGRAFLILTAEDMLQTPIPGIIIFLLTVMTTSIEEQGISARMLGAMLAYFASAIFLISHEHNLHWFNQRASAGFQRRLLLWTLLISAVIAPLVIVGASLMKPVNMYALARAGSNRQLPRWRFDFFGGGNIGIGFQEVLDVGGANWPGGRQPIMSVTVSRSAPTNLLWRAGSYNTYEGGQWSHRQPPRPPDRPAGSDASALTAMNAGPATSVWLDPLTRYGDPGLAAWMRERGLTEPPKEWLVRQQFVFERARTLGGRVPIYGAYQFYRVTTGDSAFRTAVAQIDSSVHLPYVRRYVSLANYEVESIIKPLPTTMTMRLQRDPRLPYGQRMLYTQLPGGPDSAFAQQLRTLATEIISRANRDPARLTTFDKVRLIELYLGQHYRYTLTPSAPKGGGDPIAHFLFTEKQGYCVYFSGAMVLLCRSLNIPARFVVGFGTGEADEASLTDAETETVTYRVTAEHAHAWAEVYLPNYGWYVTDPTAGSTRVPNLWGQTWDLLTEMVTIIKNNLRDLVAALKTNAVLRGRLILGGLLLLGALGVVLFLRRDRPPSFPTRPLSPDDARAHVQAAYARMHRWLRRWGVMKPAGFTAREFERAFSTLNPVLGAPVGELSALYLRAEYSEHPLTDADARRAITLLHELWRLAGIERKHLHQREAEV